MEVGRASALSQLWRQDCTHIIYIHNSTKTFAHSHFTTEKSIPDIFAFAYRIYDTYVVGYNKRLTEHPEYRGLLTLTHFVREAVVKQAHSHGAGGSINHCNTCWRTT